LKNLQDNNELGLKSSNLDYKASFPTSSSVLTDLFNIQKNDLLLSEEEVEKFYAFGFAQYGGGNWAEAVDVFRVLCTRRPFESRFWFALGATLQEAASYSDALHAWAMAALLKKEDPYPHFHAAECCLSLDWIEDSAKALREAEMLIRKDANHPLQRRISLLREQWQMK
jgi:type III secretion system low calcium response chaperone LcrH/SycD